MKSLDPKKGEAKAESKAAQTAEAAVSGQAEAANMSVTSVQLDLSKVKVEPLFEDMVDFETFSKSDFRAVNIKENCLVLSSFGFSNTSSGVPFP